MEVVHKDTFFSDIKVSSSYLHDTRACEQDKIKEGESGWVLQDVVSKACFRRQTRSGQNILHGNVCAHQQQLCQKAWNWEEASSHYPRRDAGRALLETSTELLGADQMVTAAKHRFSKTTWPHTVVGAVAGEWTDVCGFVKPPNSCDKWKVRLHGAFTIPRETLGLRPRDQSCHHEVWLHLHLVGNE